MQVSLDELHLIEFETSGCRNSLHERFVCDIRANYDPMSMG
jgi:hypothetical protein